MQICQRNVIRLMLKIQINGYYVVNVFIIAQTIPDIAYMVYVVYKTYNDVCLLTANQT